MNHFDFMDSYSLAVLIQILATLPIITATKKRSFSALKYLKTYLRNTTKEVRLNGLALLYVHRDIGLDQWFLNFFVCFTLLTKMIIRFTPNI